MKHVSEYDQQEKEKEEVEIIRHKLPGGAVQEDEYTALLAVNDTYRVDKSYKTKRACTLKKLEFYYIKDRPLPESIKDPLE
jgi:hypothetical protein